MSSVTTVDWLQIRSVLAKKLSQSSLDQWFRDAEVLSQEGTDLVIGVPNRWFKESIETNYHDELRAAAAEVCGAPVQVRVSVSMSLLGKFRQRQEQERTETMPLIRISPPKSPASALVAASSHRGVALNPDFTFERFAVGASNRLPQAVALKAVEQPGAFSRICLCGGHGVGKTHLLQAVCHAYSALNPLSRIVYTTAEKFTAEYAAAAMGKDKDDLAAFEAWYRCCDLLAFDDFQTLGTGAKRGTQAALPGILDELAARGAQVLIASTVVPSDLEGISQALKDRLAAGFVDNIALPDEDTRRAIAVRRLSEQGIVLPEPLLDILARESGGNVRQLEGVIARLEAQISLAGMEPTVSCLRMALDVARPSARLNPLVYEDIIQAVADEFGVSIENLKGRRKSAPLPKARRIALVLCRRLVGGTLAELGALFGGRGHSVIQTTIKETDPALFSDGVAARPVERILFRLGITLRPSDLLVPQTALF